MVRKLVQGESEEQGPEAYLASAARGSRRAQQELLLDHISRIRARVRRLIGPGPDCEDLVQTACIEVLRSLSRFRGQASLRLWIDRITTRTVYKHFRSKRRWRARFAWLPDPDSHASKGDDASRMEYRDGLAQAHDIVASLKPERRIVFLLVALEGLSLQEAADGLDLSLSATKSRYLRARKDVDRSLAAHPELVELLRGEHPSRTP
jgi:RNA polymerase sigma-70 factor (ECF subfamily)